MITIRLEPEGRELRFPKLSTVLQLLGRLNLARNSVLVIRNDELLTPDRRLEPGDVIILRSVASRG